MLVFNKTIVNKKQKNICSSIAKETRRYQGSGFKKITLSNKKFLQALGFKLLKYA